MKKVLLLLLILNLFQHFCWAQKDTTFFDAGKKKCKKNQAEFYRLIEKHGKEFLVKEFYVDSRPAINNTPKLIAICSAVEPDLVFNGKYTSYYYDNTGYNIYEGYYPNNSLSGVGMLITNNNKDTAYLYNGFDLELDSILHERLYIGIDNPVTISMAGLPSEKLRVSTTNGTIEGKNGKYIVKVLTEETDTFKVYFGDKFMGVQTKRVYQLPDPVSYIGSANGECSPSREDIVKTGCITVKRPRCDIDPKYTVISFNMAILEKKSNSYADYSSSSACLTEKMKELILNRDLSSKVLIEEVKVIGQDGIKRKIGGIIMRFDFDDMKIGLAIEKQKVLQENEKIIVGENKIKEQKSKAELLTFEVEKQNNILLDRKKEIANKEKEISNQKETLTAQVGEIKSKTTFLWGAIIVIIIVIGLMIFSINSYLKKKQANLKLEEQNIVIAEKNQEITDSINYAQRIQKSILPPLTEVKSAFPNSFILFKPKDIVSGDFYWFYVSQESEERSGEKKDSPLIFIAAADCTGHGVPGAFMSTIGSEKLNEAVKDSSDVSLILNFVNRGMKKVLRQSDKIDSTRDGMDIALCTFNKEMTKVEFAGANRPLWIVRKHPSPSERGRGEVIEETKATKVAIGGFTDDEQIFTKHTIDLQKGDTVYIFSDGYADQFSPQDKKLMTRKFKELILSVQNKSMEDQRDFLDTFIENWRGDLEQTDDILVIGVRV